VYQAVHDAAERARNGEGPTLIEAINYRLGPHSMSGDDPTRYRAKDEPSEYDEKEPLVRFRRYLESKGLWTEADENQVIEEAKQAVTDAIKKAESYEKMTVDQLIDAMYEVTPPHLEKQKAEFAKEGK
jgi:pyruvate dehydrogenase E1 component alpha subunit